MRGSRVLVGEELPKRFLTAAALLVSMGLMAGLGVLVLWGAGWGFWPKKLQLITLRDGTQILGEKWDEERVGPERAVRLRFKVGNRDVWGSDFRVVPQEEVLRVEEPPNAWLVERWEYGNFYGFPVHLRRPQEQLAAEDPRFATAMREELARMAAVRREAERLSKRLAKTLEPREEDLLRLAVLQGEQEQCWLVMKTVTGEQRDLPCAQVVHAWPLNQLHLPARLKLFAQRWVEFLTAEPRESNTEGGIFPALFGTALLVLLMTIGVVPLGVLTAVYLREYARDNRLTRAVRLAVSTLAGVPSIVFGAFGLAFFVYTVGGAVDRLFFSHALPTPTFGTGGILWASATLALLTLPVVVVATEEGLAAAPTEVREGAQALGATRWETLRHVVLPYAKPGIFTGMILAVARAAGEVAPLMLTGVVKLAPALPLDSTPPFFHLERKFMHLGFHIYDVGFQSPNVEAARPMVFATTLVLLILVVVLNFLALRLRNRARARVLGHTL
ncbi:MAG: phosphate ABC transporter permease PstA [Thermoanaerobaculum sp.]|nr:phosphate ABC transporter permease PstA [Thermoanaerobaculum sp.]